MPAHELLAKLDRLIQFDNDQAPKTGSWNPFKAHRQRKELKEWVKNRPPGAGITGEDLEKQYPAPPGRTKHMVGGAVGGLAGAAAGIYGGVKLAKHLKIKDPRGLINVGASVGGGLGAPAGWFASDPEHFLKTHREHKADIETFKKHFAERSVDVSGLKASAPIATSHMQVAGELKKQNVGFLKRHGAALSTFPIRHSTNAAFLPLGDKGVIVSGKKIPKTVIAHEGGHATDYAHYGGEAGFKQAYPKYGQASFNPKTYIHNTLLPEHRAWAHANPRSKQDRDLKDAALRTYARGGMLLSEKLDELINFGVAQVAHSPLGREMLKLRNKAHAELVTSANRAKNARALKKLLEDNKHLMNFADPRPRNNLGEFSGNQEGVPDPNAMAKTYQQPQQPQQVPASQKKSALEGAGLVLAGGALGAIGGKAGNHAYDTVVKHVKNLAAMAKKGKVKP